MSCTTPAQCQFKTQHILFVSGTVKFVFERSVQSKYCDETSALTCTSISQCFSFEEKNKIDEEFGITSTNVTSIPPQYDPCTWRWELTGLSLSKWETINIKNRHHFTISLFASSISHIYLCYMHKLWILCNVIGFILAIYQQLISCQQREAKQWQVDLRNGKFLS